MPSFTRRRSNIQKMRDAIGLPTEARLQELEKEMDDTALEAIQKKISETEQQLQKLLQEQNKFSEEIRVMAQEMEDLKTAYSAAGGRFDEEPGEHLQEARRIKLEMNSKNDEETRVRQLQFEHKQTINLCQKELQTLYTILNTHQKSYDELLVNRRFEQKLKEVVFKKIQEEFLLGPKYGKTYEELKNLCESGAIYAIALLENRITGNEKTACIQAGWDVVSENLVANGLPSDFFSNLVSSVHKTYETVIKNVKTLEISSNHDDKQLAVTPLILKEIAMLMKTVKAQKFFKQEAQNSEYQKAIDTLISTKVSTELKLASKTKKTELQIEQYKKEIKQYDQQIKALQAKQNPDIVKYKKFRDAVINEVLKSIEKDSGEHAFGKTGPIPKMNFEASCSYAALYILATLEGAPQTKLDILKMACEKAHWEFGKWDVPKIPGWPDSLFYELQKLVYDTYKKVISVGETPDPALNREPFPGYPEEFAPPASRATPRTHTPPPPLRLSQFQLTAVHTEEMFKDLFGAIHAKDHLLLNQLLEKLPHAIVNTPNKDGVTLLHAAAMKDIPLAVTVTLLAKGANPNILDASGQTPLSLAALNGREDLIEEIYEPLELVTSETWEQAKKALEDSMPEESKSDETTAKTRILDIINPILSKNPPKPQQ